MCENFLSLVIWWKAINLLDGRLMVLYVGGYQTQYRSWSKTEGKHISGMIVGLMMVHWLQDLVGFISLNFLKCNVEKMGEWIVGQGARSWRRELFR